MNSAQGWETINHWGWERRWKVDLQLSLEKAVVISEKREKGKALGVRREPDGSEWKEPAVWSPAGSLAEGSVGRPEDVWERCSLMKGLGYISWVQGSGPWPRVLGCNC